MAGRGCIGREHETHFKHRSDATQVAGGSMVYEGVGGWPRPGRPPEYSACADESSNQSSSESSRCCRPNCTDVAFASGAVDGHVVLCAATCAAFTYRGSEAPRGRVVANYEV